MLSFQYFSFTSSSVRDPFSVWGGRDNGVIPPSPLCVYVLSPLFPPPWVPCAPPRSLSPPPGSGLPCTVNLAAMWMFCFLLTSPHAPPWSLCPPSVTDPPCSPSPCDPPVSPWVPVNPHTVKLAAAAMWMLYCFSLTSPSAASGPPGASSSAMRRARYLER